MERDRKRITYFATSALSLRHARMASAASPVLVVAVENEKILRSYSVSTGKLVKQVPYPDQIKSLALSPTGSMVMMLFPLTHSYMQATVFLFQRIQDYLLPFRPPLRLHAFSRPATCIKPPCRHADDTLLRESHPKTDSTRSDSLMRKLRTYWQSAASSMVLLSPG